ncbi:hypothetical protein Q31a_28240 [Aureliella helgolandensis]|uniref:Uncharacterized protein n=1 Tax=Aureliella helgolandensis TaxID=2527968 RepID=A0A518G7D5_9BACT|nr:hypothetical protein Q31a_28240 [Aureliella helgolandensis]
MHQGSVVQKFAAIVQKVAVGSAMVAISSRVPTAKMPSNAVKQLEIVLEFPVGTGHAYQAGEVVELSSIMISL